MRSIDAIDIIMSSVKKTDIVLSTTGYISRYLFSYEKRHRANFYMIGSMGLLSSVGLGLALNTRRKIFILDGDGSCLMDLGTMAMIGYHKPSNLIHIVLDNGAYQSTGGQGTITDSINLASLAASANYKEAASFNDMDALKKGLGRIVRKKGPSFIRIKLKNDKTVETGRISLEPDEITDKIRNILKDEK